MTVTVRLSISVETENGERKSIQAQIGADNFENDLKQLCQEVIEVTGQEVLAGYEAKLKAEKSWEGVSIRESNLNSSSSTGCFHFSNERQPTF